MLHGKSQRKGRGKKNYRHRGRKDSNRNGRNIVIVEEIVMIIVTALTYLCSLFIHLFIIITFPEKKIDYSTIINEECGVVRKTTVSDISDLSIVTKNTPESVDIPNHALALKTGDYHIFFSLCHDIVILFIFLHQEYKTDENICIYLFCGFCK